MLRATTEKDKHSRKFLITIYFNTVSDHGNIGKSLWLLIPIISSQLHEDL